MNALSILPAPSLLPLPALPGWLWQLVYDLVVKLVVELLKPTLKALGERIKAALDRWFAR